jgi:uncharacterized protein (AIM24 family)
MSTYTCNWCGTVSDGSGRSCPACGAAVDVRAMVTESGWTEMPARPDMARLQFGQSYVQIEGNTTPVADVSLAAGDGVYFTHHVVLWMDATVKVHAMSLKGAWKRLFAGMPLVMTEAIGPGHIAFSQDSTGEIVALPLQPGQMVDVREHMFLLATHSVAYDWFNTNIWYSTRNGDDTETHYPVGMFMDRFQATDRPGLLLLHAAGNVYVRDLGPNDSLLVKPTALIFKDPSVHMQLHFEYPAGVSTSFWFGMSWSNRYLWLRLFGPGRVAVNSACKPHEDPPTPVYQHSGASSSQW